MKTVKALKAHLFGLIAMVAIITLGMAALTGCDNGTTTTGGGGGPNPNAGKTWTAVGDSAFGSSSNNIWAVARGKDKFVAAGGLGKMAYSADGKTWTAVESSAFGVAVYAVAWGNNKFVAGGANGKMAYSADGITWTAVEDSTFGDSNIWDLAWGGDKFVAVGIEGKMAYSADGITWTAVEESTFGSEIVRALAWDGNKFVAVGNAGKMAYSDGTAPAHQHDFDSGEWQNDDAEGHYKECPLDNEKGPLTPHSPTDGVCSTCGFNNTPHAHQLVKTEAAAATCTAAGNPDYWTCSVCDRIFEDAGGETELTRAQTVIEIDLNAHAYVWTTTTATSFTAAGEEQEICGNNAAHRGDKRTVPMKTGTLDSVDEVAAYLATQSANTADNPILLPLNFSLGTMTQTNSNWQLLLGALNTANKFVELDLSACGMNGTEFNPASSVATGKDKIVAITLPEAGETITAGTLGTSTSPFTGFTSLESVTIPGGYTAIPDNAFYGRNSLKSVAIGGGVESIGNDAFYGCSGLESVTIAADNPSYTSLNNIVYSKDMATLVLATDRGISGSVTIPDGVTEIGNYAFQYCAGLESVDIPDGVTTIGGLAFSGCSGLTSVTIPASVTGIGDRAFENCTSLASVVFESGAITEANFNTWAGFGGNLRAMYLSRGRGTYTRDNSVVPIPNTVPWAFEAPPIDLTKPLGLGEFRSILGQLEPNSADDPYQIILNISDLGGGSSASGSLGYILRYERSDKYVSLDMSGSTLTSIVVGAFDNCWNLTSVTIPDSVTDIGASAFYQCMNLTSVTIGSGVETIGDSAFAQCGSLMSVTFERAGTTFRSTGTGISPSFPGAASLQTAYTAGGAGTYIQSNITWTWAKEE